MAYTDNFDDALVSLVNSMVAADRLNMSNLLYEAAWPQSDLSAQHQIVTGIRSGHTVPVLNNEPNPDSFPFVDPTVCAVTECDVDNEFSSRSWELGLLECRVPICLRSFSEDFLLFFNQWRQTQQGTPNLDSAIIQFINSRFTANLVLAEWRAAYFGDKDSVNPLYNGINGFFAQAEANPDLVVPITENDGATFADQRFADGEAVYNYLVQMYELAMTFPWFDPARFEFKVTKSMAVQLVSWLNKLGLKAPMGCACIDPVTATQRPYFGIVGLQINGLPVTVHAEWDTIINGSTELNGGGGTAARVNPHRALLTTRTNQLVGTSETGALQSFDIWYSKDQKKVFIEGSSYIGAAFSLDHYILAI